MEEHIELFISFLEDIKHSSKNTVESYKRDLTQMRKFFESQGITSTDKINGTNINTYILWMEKNGKSQSTVARSCSSMKAFFHYMLQLGNIKSEPTMLMKAPTFEKKVPTVLSLDEIVRLLEKPDAKTNKGCRDKAMLELMYATGIRVSELIELKVDDVNLDLGYLVCRDREKERIIPFGLPAEEALREYIYSVRGKMCNPNVEYLFVNFTGKQFTRQGIWKIIKYYGNQAGIEEDKITPHVLRHSFAYHLVENGANLTAVKDMLGHSMVASTAIYEKMSEEKTGSLRNEYVKSHPRKRKQ